MPVPASRFTWKGTRGVAEVSDLGDCWIRAYPDACDDGIDVVSDRTGATVRFVVVKTDRNSDEVVSWLLKSVDKKRTLTLIVFND